LGAIYGVLAGLLQYLWPLLADQTRMTGIGIGNGWVRALITGFFIKGLLHIRLVNVATGPGKSFPLGLESIVRIFEPWLLTEIGLHVFSAKKVWLKKHVGAYADVAMARARALDNIPSGFDPAEQASLRADIKRADSAEKVLDVYVTYAGPKALASVFPAAE
jgi:hypothetical protein